MFTSSGKMRLLLPMLKSPSFSTRSEFPTHSHPKKPESGIGETVDGRMYICIAALRLIVPTPSTPTASLNLPPPMPSFVIIINSRWSPLLDWLNNVMAECSWPVGRVTIWMMSAQYGHFYSFNGYSPVSADSFYGAPNLPHN